MVDPSWITITIALIAMGNIHTKIYHGDTGVELHTGCLLTACPLVFFTFYLFFFFFFFFAVLTVFVTLEFPVFSLVCIIWLFGSLFGPLMPQNCRKKQSWQIQITHFVQPIQPVKKLKLNNIQYNRMKKKTSEYFCISFLFDHQNSCWVSVRWQIIADHPCYISDLIQ